MFDASLSRRRARSSGLLVSIAVHALTVLLFWHSKGFERTLTGIQVVHASGIEPVWLPVKNAETSRHETSQRQLYVETPVPQPIPVPSEEDRSTGGTETIPRDISASLDDGPTSDLSEQIMQTRLKEIARLDMEQPQPLAGRPPELEEKPTEIVGNDDRIGRQLEPARLLSKTIPVYPPLGKTARIQGVVVLEATISESGSLEDVTVISGHPILVRAAVDAVRQWRYAPARLNGRPVRSSVSINVNFKLEFQ